MTATRALGAALALAGLLGVGTGVALAAPAGQAGGPASERSASEGGSVRWREIISESGATRIRLEAPSQTAYELSTIGNPPAVELELKQATLAGFPPRVKVGDGLVEAVETSPASDGARRLRVLLAAPCKADVSPWSGGLDLLIRPVHSAEAPQVMQPPLAKLTDDGGLSFSFGQAPSKVSAFALSDRRRLVIDAEGVTLSEPQFVEEYPEGAVSRVRLARQEGRVRCVVEVRKEGALEGYQVAKTAAGFDLSFGRPAAALPPEPEKARPETTAAKPEIPAKPSAAAAKANGPEVQGGGEVVDFGFRQDAAASLVEIVASKPARHQVREASGKRVVVDLLRTNLPTKFRRALDTSAFSGPVVMVAAYPRKNGTSVDTRVVIDLRRPAALRVEQTGERTLLVVDGGEAPAASPAAGVSEVRRAGDEVVIVEGKPPAQPPRKSADPPVATGTPGGPAAAGEPRRPAGTYAGRHLSLDFVDADIRNVLRIIGEVSGLNVVAGDDVQGKLTVRLVDVPWDQALEVILKTRGLDQVREGNVIRIAPAERLSQEKARARDAEKGIEDKAPLVSDIIDVNYASAQELADKVKAVLTPRGSVAVDQRTNAILVKDLPSKLQEARALVARLDTPTPQVVIEARIVEVSSTFSRDLGVQWGGKFKADTAHGNATDWAFPNSIGVAGATGTKDFAVNFPAAVAPGGPGGALALSLGHINDVLSLDLRLSALEASGQGRVVSSPRVSTLDNRTAEISQGVSIPFTSATQEKVETKSIDYLLKLNVTPHVTADRAIIMKIDVHKDAPSTTFKAADDKTPAKETRSATTEVLVRDGETTVIGGIITDQKGTTVRGVPFLSKIPVLGWLFKGKTDDTIKTELIIFITPKISTPAVVARRP